ncbi:low affinity potassium transporter [Purpureocillium takamizusanense]|uniref:Potassium transport protein n=1 Tax=Purpureocillium takamizusanense TaxID=2060973 RepID=A0A9Q8V797_9HYPO|nr:low affinity potassium transporter [Purpureocillium takamizusanense]UNI14196.1 low affinity potassium transporter [Purpureocillium takamizusanense]
MLEGARKFLWAQLLALKPACFSKKPHFNFISVHYFWIIAATIIASIAIYASGRGELAYIDALMFGSGANTQAGLNPVDLNKLNGFQQGMIYLFAMVSNPITMHSCVVFLRLYWFEKRFQRWVREARLRRPTFTRSKSKSRPDAELARPVQGVNGRDITVMPHDGRTPRITNDGILLDDAAKHHSRPAGVAKSDESDTTTVTDEKSSGGAVGSPDEHLTESANGGAGVTESGRPLEEQSHGQRTDGTSAAQTAISFADTVKRSDGMGEDALKLPQRRTHAEHIAILERQRQEDSEVLRIPGPRDAERGEGPRRLQAEESQYDDDNALARLQTADSRVDQQAVGASNRRGRNPTITIAEPEWRQRKEELTEDARAAAGTLESLRFRKPRTFNSGQKRYHEDGEERQPRPVRTRTMDTIRSALSRDKQGDMPYLSYTPTTGRNSNFIGLTLEQREELGGIEYRSLRTLALILLFYFWGFQLVILSCLLPYILHNNTYGKAVDDAGVTRTWWGFFTSNVAFMDVGFTLTPDSMISFQQSQFVLMIMWFFIIIGNTGFPVMLRFIIWVAAKVVPSGSGVWEELRFLLDHPRRCFTLLFPSGPNWWLFWILVMLNAVDLLFFLVLDLGTEPIARLPLHNRVVVGFFQAASTRTAGFSAVSLTELHPAMPVLYMIMMYISVFPIAISIRRTNVYEEKSLGVYHVHNLEDDGDAPALNYVGSHLRRQLSFDLWYVFLGFFIIIISEGGKIQDGNFNLFDVLFEVVSAYGTVGLSMGAKGINASLCSEFSVVGKLVIIAMQIRGRHRGLPYGLDRAVMLPSEARFQKEAEEAEAMLARINTGMSSATTSGMQRQPTHTNTARSRSISRERPPSNVIAQFLHPGPVVPRDRDITSNHYRRGSGDSRGLSLGARTNTEPIIEDEMEDLEELNSGGSSRFSKPRRVETAPEF